MMTGKTLFIAFLFLLRAADFTGSHTLTVNKEAIKAGNNVFGERYLSLHEPSLKPNLYMLGIKGFEELKNKGMIVNDSLLTLIDFSLPSSEERFFVINLASNTVIYKSLVAHGKNSGELYASRFSNRPHSYQSALGFYITGQDYLGGQGYSMQLIGVDTGFNDHSLARGIVLHGADYATASYIRRYGRLGRSQGCPAIPRDLSRAVIDLIRNGSVFFCYYPDPVYLQQSAILHGGDQIPE